MGFYIYAGAVWLFLGSTGDPNYGTDGTFKGYNKDPALRWMQLYHVFGIFWISTFIIGVGQMTMAGAVASWYFAPKQADDEGHQTSKLSESLGWPIARAVKNTLFYHLGTVAFGSFIIPWPSLPSTASTRCSGRSTRRTRLS